MDQVSTKGLLMKMDSSYEENAFKTPICLLQEICAQYNFTSSFEVKSVEGAVHAPTFVYEAKIKNITASGSGPSKKKAKHNAAKSVLEKLKDADISSKLQIVLNNYFANKVEQLESQSTSNTEGNLVGKLQEHCMEKRLPPPIYEMINENGSAHERNFTMSCSIGNVIKEGNGKSKKLAKREAASKMYEYVLSSDNLETLVKMTQGKKMCENVGNCTVQRTNKNLASSCGYSLSKLDEMNIDPSNCKLYLYKISVEENLEVIYMHVDLLNRHGKHQCLLKLLLDPVAVCYGVGDSKDEAEINATIDALNYLYLITKQKL